MYGTYNGSLNAFCARFSITITTTSIVAMSTVLKTRSGSHYRVYVTVFSLHLAVLPRGSHAGRGRVRDSERVTAGGERVFEHQEAHPAPPGGGTPTHSLSRHAQPMPWSCNGRREHSRQPRRAVRGRGACSVRSGQRWAAGARATTRHGCYCRLFNR